ncbi:MAG: PsbP-related protein [bacterium]|nr:PsbP-related protein [bacterium]
MFKKQDSNKGFTSIILILFILVAVGIGGWYFLNQSSFKSLITTTTPTPTHDPTANWKTYTNTKYGYSIKYPKDWDVQEFPAVDAYLEVTSFNPDKVTDRLTAIIVTVSSNPYEKELSGYEGAAIVKVGDFTAREETGGAPPGSTDVHLRVVAPLGTKSIVFESNTGYEKIFDQVLSTFKFTGEKTGEQKVFCTEPRSEVCTMECITNPPYLCGSDGKSYCSSCRACSNKSIEWYVIQQGACGS